MSGSGTPIYDPATGAASGAGRTPFPGNQIPAARIDPIALKVSNMLPLPNVPGNALTNNYDGSGTYTFGRERADSKINWNPTSKLTSFARFSMLKFDMYDPPVFGAAGGIDINPQGGQPGNAHGASYSLTASATYMLKSNLILDGYFAWENDNTAVEPDAIGQNVGQQWGIPGTNGPARYQSGMPWFSVTNYSLFGTAGSQTGGFPYYRDNAQHQEVVNLSWIHGRARIPLRHRDSSSSSSTISSPANAQGAFTFGTGPTQVSGGPSGNQFNSYATFLLGLVTSANQTVVFADPPAEPINQHWFSAYFRDRWTISRKLTASLGLRWDYYGFPNARTRGIGVYDIASNQVQICGSGQVPDKCGISMPKQAVLAAPGLGVPFLGPLRDPRRLRHQPDSVFAGPFGAEPVSDHHQPDVSLSELVQLVRHASRRACPPITLPVPNNGLLVAPNNVNMSVLPKDFPWPYTQSWNVTLQKELRYGFTAQAGYVASRTVRSMTQDSGATINLNAGQFIGAGQNGQPFFQTQGRTSNVSLYTPRGTISYNSLQTTLNRRFTQGLQMSAAWTWAKSESPNYPTDALSLPVPGVAARCRAPTAPTWSRSTAPGSFPSARASSGWPAAAPVRRFSAVGPSTAWPCSTADCRSR